MDRFADAPSIASNSFRVWLYRRRRCRPGDAAIPERFEHRQLLDPHPDMGGVLDDNAAADYSQTAD